MTELTDIDLEESLIRYTSFYRRLGISGKRDPQHPQWQQYLAAIREGEDPLNHFYDLYMARKEQQKDQSKKERPYGAFRYENEGEGVVSIHFSPQPQDVGLLRKEYISERLDELTRMFADIKKHESDIREVHGNSWTYNLNAYRRLLPPEYTDELIINPKCFQGSSAWAQFFKSDQSLNQERIDEYYENLKELDPMNPHLVFPFQVYQVSAPIQAFYDFYGLS